MRLTQSRILGLKMLAMGTTELRNEIYKQAEENPALEITDDPLYADGYTDFSAPSVRTKKDAVHMGTPSAAGEADADEFQKLLEARPDTRTSLQSHLERQLNLLFLPAAEYGLCHALIRNLDSNGRHILSPISPVRTETPAAEKEALLERCLNIVQHFDPAGVCCADVQESLELQAACRTDAPFLARFLLHGHLDLLTPPLPEKIHKKLLALIAAQSHLVFTTDADFPELTRENISLPRIESALAFIRTLDPYPARNFGNEDAAFADADIFVTRKNGSIDADDFDAGLVFDTESEYFQVTFDSGYLPAVRIAADFSVPHKDVFVKNYAAAARDFLSNLAYRERALVKTCSVLVKLQLDFFKNGTGHIAPLTQKKFAEAAGVHKSTVSRMADSKFIRCEWGVFPIRHFFSGSVPRVIQNDGNPTLERTSFFDTDDWNSARTAEDSPFDRARGDGGAVTEVSSDTVRREIALILESRPTGARRLSDQNIADLLAERGYKIARRTVAKYRALLKIGSSYTRE